MPEGNGKAKINWSLTALLFSVFINILLGGTLLAVQKQQIEIASLDKRTTVLEYQFGTIREGIEELKEILQKHAEERP